MILAHYAFLVSMSSFACNYFSTLQLQHIVHIVTNVDKAFKSYEDWKRNLIFVELDVQRQGEDTTFRTSQFVQLSPDGLCFMEDHTWKEKVVVNIMTPIRNQVVWLKYLIQMLEEIVGVTHEIDVSNEPDIAKLQQFRRNTITSNTGGCSLLDYQRREPVPN